MFSCIKCGKEFSKEFNLKRHMENRKFPCDKNYDIKIIEDKTRYCCQHCPKNYSRKIYLDKHIEHEHQNIKMQNELESLKIKLDEAIKLITTMNSNPVNNTTINNNTNNTNNIQNNIQNNYNFHNPNLSYLLEYIIKSDLLSEAAKLELIPKIAEIIYFNKDHPENHFIFLYDENIGFALEDNVIKLYDYPNGINQIHKNCSKIIDDQFTHDELKPEDYKKYKELLSFVKNNNKELYIKIMSSNSSNPLYKDFKDSVLSIEKLLIDKSDMVKNTLKNTDYVNAKVIKLKQIKTIE